LLQAMGEIAIFLGRFLQAVDDARASAAVAVTVLLGKFRHPSAAHTDPQPNHGEGITCANAGSICRRYSLTNCRA
jgi:hypothetical protein